MTLTGFFLQCASICLAIAMLSVAAVNFDRDDEPTAWWEVEDDFYDDDGSRQDEYA